jgi:glutathione S-transferase
MLHYCNVQFHDRRYNQQWDAENEQWDRSEWMNEKFNLGMEFPNLPYLFDEDTKLTETLAIMQYIAKKWKPELLGRNAAEVGRIHMLEEKVYKLKFATAGPCYAPDADRQKIVETARPMLAGLYEVTGNSTFLCGENITYLDFMYHELIDVLAWLSEGAFLEEFPNLTAYCERMMGLYPEFW